MGLPIREVLLWLIWLRVLVVGDFLALAPELSNILPLKELLEDFRALEETSDLGVVARLGAALLGALLRVILELLLAEGLEELTMELLLVEGLVVLTLALLLVEDLEELTLGVLLVEGLEVLTLELLMVEGLEVLILELLLVEGLEVLTLALLLVEGLEVLTRELLLVEDLEELALELEDLEGAELLEADRLLPLDLLLRLCLAKTGPESNIMANTTDRTTALRFFECFRVNMAYLLYFTYYFRFLSNPIYCYPFASL